MAPSSSGPGHLVLIQKIAGSIPAGVTSKKGLVYPVFFDCHLAGREPGGAELVTISASRAPRQVSRLDRGVRFPPPRVRYLKEVSPRFLGSQKVEIRLTFLNELGDKQF
ncbi:MAG: hypothetical protein UX47_C0010G0003 [Candidatus Collierbacteria bacterium GW2011_GWA2_46_26]|uniref:Uncharacterized protein n=1 Tax=Candidatus Collierbacteria bacterium GW2011_GWA2_46_26 TaxID=1618381 RepID=A0A0G1PIE9_9BACT|nr:MAG: hypothetical protein UW29_C0010G0003 [Candidatus Collierbacteria bacterium GW2011_GWC2_44_13]KKU32487.1 MAG: hypothetical protein UX47_C0010G0003 [Candidatus Collierbacteria bacterium GW2011_GWA2_46_26]